MVFGPGRNCDSAKVSLNSSLVIQRLCSTIMRRDQGKAPPKAASDTCVKALNNSSSVGLLGACAAGSGVSSEESDIGLSITIVRLGAASGAAAMAPCRLTPKEN